MQKFGRTYEERGNSTTFASMAVSHQALVVIQLLISLLQLSVAGYLVQKDINPPHLTLSSFSCIYPTWSTFTGHVIKIIAFHFHHQTFK